MSLFDKVRAVEGVFKDLDEAISGFQSWSTLHCKFGCGKCCSKPDIEASILEFLPFAYYIFKQDKAFEWLEKLKSVDALEICLIWNPTQQGVGLCSEYIYRGLICRLFGYSARINKYGAKELITCQIIKTEQKDQYAVVQEKLSHEGSVPVMSHYYMQLHAIDQEMARDFYPINQAIQKAIEIVLHYYAYRNKEEE